MNNGTLYRMELGNSGNVWNPEANNFSTAEDARRIKETEGQLLSFIRYHGIADQYTLPADLITLRLFCQETIMVYNLGKAIYNALGYSLQLSTDGKRGFSGIKVCKLARPNPIQGIYYPDDYRVLKPITPNSTEGETLGLRQEVMLASIFLATTEKDYGLNPNAMAEVLRGKYTKEATQLVDLAKGSALKIRSKKIEGEEVFFDAKGNELDVGEVEELMDLKYKSDTYRELRRKFNEVWSDFCLSNSKNQAVSNILSEEIIRHEVEKIDVDGLGHSIRYLPKKEWFSKEIRENVDLSLLSIFPEAERNVFGLFLGRTVAGRTGQVYTSGKVNKMNWRGMPVLISAEGGNGKSIFSEKLTDTLKCLGYTFGNFPPSMSGNFGFATPANSDLTYIDDCDEDTLPGIIGSATLKSLVSNSGNFSAHQKGKDHVTIQHPRCSVYVITNSFPIHKMSLDGGMISRILPMKLHLNNDLAAKEFTEKTGLRFPLNDAISDMSKRCNCSEEAIIAYLLRLGFDYYYSMGDTDNLIKELIEQTNKFKLNLKADHQKAMMMKYILVYRRTRGCEPTSFDAGDFLKTLMFSMNNYATEEGLKDGICGGVWSKGIEHLATTNYQFTASLTSVVASSNSVKKIFSEFMDTLTSTNGSNYNRYINFWSNLFQECLDQFKDEDPLDDLLMTCPKLLASLKKRMASMGIHAEINPTLQREGILTIPDNGEVISEIKKILPKL